MVDVDEVLALFERGVICVPVRPGSKHPDYGAMGLAFDSLAFWLSQHPPDREELRRWFSRHEGNVGIVSGYKGLAVLDIDNAGCYDRIIHDVLRGKKLAAQIATAKFHAITQDGFVVET